MIIAVASGKGGTGKTTVSVNLAASAPVPVRLVDCDVEEPNAHLFLPLKETERTEITTFVPQVDPDRCTVCGACDAICQFSALVTIGKRLMVFPEMCHGCRGCIRVCPQDAITEDRRVLGEAIRCDTDATSLLWGQLRIGEAMSPPLIEAVRKAAGTDRPVIIDAPPGTSCPMIAAVRETDFVILVTEPTPFGLNDLTLAVDTVRELGIPCGIVVNRAEPGNHLIQDYAASAGVPVLLEIPFTRAYAETYSRGRLLVGEDPELKAALSDLFDRIASLVAENKTERRAG